MTKPDLTFEQQLGYPSSIIAGSDEVGRGCLAGPVVAAAVVLPSKISFKRDPWLLEINDSKKLTASSREKLVPLIQGWAASTAIGFASVEEIDQLNIFHASHLAILRAIDSLRIRPQHVLIDGKFIPSKGLSVPASPVIQGDQKCISIAAASIIAKVWRDQHMTELDQHFPAYGFAQHKGYPTQQHTDALKKYGISKMHRCSFKTVKALKDASLLA